MFQWLLSWVSLPSADEICTGSLLLSTAGTEVVTWVSFFLLGMGSSGHPLLLGRGPGGVSLLPPSATICKEARWGYLLLTMQVCALTQLSHVRLCDPMDWGPQAPLSMGILQARILEWIAIPPPGDLPDPEIEPRSPALQADPLVLPL